MIHRYRKTTRRVAAAPRAKGRVRTSAAGGVLVLRARTGAHIPRGMCGAQTVAGTENWRANIPRGTRSRDGAETGARIPRGMCDAKARRRRNRRATFRGECATREWVGIASRGVRVLRCESRVLTFRGECATRETVVARANRRAHSAGNVQRAKPWGRGNRHATFRAECAAKNEDAVKSRPAARSRSRGWAERRGAGRRRRRCGT
jgi:hypothetical protein